MTHRSNDYLTFLAITLVMSAVPALAMAASSAVNGTIKSDQEPVSSTLATNTDTTTKPTIAGSNTGNTTVVTPVGRTKSKVTPISPALPTDGSQPVLNSTTGTGAGVSGAVSTGEKK